jgi:transposase
MCAAASANPSIRFITSLPGRLEPADRCRKRREVVETIRNRVAGLDVHRDRVVACVRLADVGGRVRTHKRSFSTMTVGVAELSQWLGEFDVTTAVMESTGVDWKPIYYGLEGSVAELWLVNATHAKRVPGRNDLTP